MMENLVKMDDLGHMVVPFLQSTSKALLASIPNPQKAPTNDATTARFNPLQAGDEFLYQASNVLW